MTRQRSASFTVYLETYGCQMNVYDSQSIQGLLIEAGYRLVDDDQQADVILLNTCSVREHAEHRVLSRVGELRSRRRSADLKQPLIGICGCMAERLQEALQQLNQRIDLVVGVDQYDRLPGLLQSLLAADAKPNAVLVGHRPDVHLVAPPELYPINNSHLVTIHKGCDYCCTYCIVPYTRGPQAEKDPEAILAEIRQITAGGGQEVTLLGQNVTAYHWAGELDFAALLERVTAETDIQRVRFLTGHPRDMHPALMDKIGVLDKVCPWLHLPIQSGSDRILRRMKRLYTRQEYLDMVQYARQVIPGVTFSSDFIVGFPGETPADFEDTLEILRQVKYDQIFSFKYSERPGVPAARLADDVLVPEKKRRLAALMALQEEIWNHEAANLVGSTWTGIVEGPARRPENGWRLRTANNRKLVVEGGDLTVGMQAAVRITGWRNTTFMGELLA